METLNANFRQLKKDGIPPERFVLGELLEFYGPLPPELSAYVNDTCATQVLKELSERQEAQDPSLRLEHFDEKRFQNLDAEAKRFLRRMLNLDPKQESNHGPDHLRSLSGWS